MPDVHNEPQLPLVTAILHWSLDERRSRSLDEELNLFCATIHNLNLQDYPNKNIFACVDGCANYLFAAESNIRGKFHGWNVKTEVIEGINNIIIRGGDGTATHILLFDKLVGGPSFKNLAITSNPNSHIFAINNQYEVWQFSRISEAVQKIIEYPQSIFLVYSDYIDEPTKIPVYLRSASPELLLFSPFHIYGPIITAFALNAIGHLVPELTYTENMEWAVRASTNGVVVHIPKLLGTFISDYGMPPQNERWNQEMQAVHRKYVPQNR